VTDLHPVTALVTGVLGAASGLLVPRLIAAVPEPEPDRPDGAETGSRSGPDGAPDEGADPSPAEPAQAPEVTGPEEPKEPYAAIAARPGLAWRCAVAAGLCAAAVGLVLGRSLDLLVVLPLVPLGVALSVIDWRTRLLPTRLVAPGYALVVVAILVAWLAGDRDVSDLGRTALGWLIYGGMFFLLWFVYPRGLGYGDVRLSGVLGLALGWVGWAELLLGIWSGLLLGGVLGAVLSLATRRRDYPFGPFMLVGALVGLLVGQSVLPGLPG